MQPKRRPRKPKRDGEKIAAPGTNEFIEPYESDNPLLGIPALLEPAPTTEIVVHALFTAQHVINELRYHFEMRNLQPADLHMLAVLGKEIIDYLEKEAEALCHV